METDALPAIRLTKGAGTPGEAACWMSALSQWLGGKWTDRLECVSPIINHMCITINDGLPNDGARRRVIMPMLLEPVGTFDPGSEVARRALLIGCARRQWVPIALESAANVNERSGAGHHAEALRKHARALRENPTAENLDAAREAATEAARDAGSNALGTTAGSAAREAAGSAVWVLAGGPAGSAGWSAVAAAAGETAGGAGWNAAKERFFADHVIPVLRECIRMGKHAPEEPACAMPLDDWGALCGAETCA